MKKLRNVLAKIHCDGSYIILNHFVNHLPCWTVRKSIYKLFGLKIGKGSRIMMGVVLLEPKGINIGENNIINEFALLDGRFGLEIGDNNSISMYAVIYSATHKSYSDSFEYTGKKTIIKDNVWIGTHGVVMPGSVVNNFSIISVNSVFKGVSLDGGIYMGNPAMLSRERGVNNPYTISYSPYFR